MKTELIETVKKYISAIEDKNDINEIFQFYHPDVEQIEYPNILLKNKIIRRLNDLREAYLKGKAVLQSEKYKIINSYVQDNLVIIEAEWTGVLAVPFGNKKIGDEIKANFAQFYEFKNGKIFRQRNYDCFDPI
jgi:ketosteroid isomerase-like protein